MAEAGPSLSGPSTAEPSTAEPSTAEPSTAEPSTAEPSMAEPSTAGPYIAEPYTAGPYTAGPYTAEPSAAEPSTAGPSTAGPSMAEPSTTEPTTAGPSTAEPSTAEPYTVAPFTVEPYVAEPYVAEPYTAGPSAAYFHSSQETILRRIGSAEALKLNGNDCYKEKNYRGAIGKYHRALLTVKDIDQRSRGLMMQSITGIPDTSQPLPGIAADRVYKIELSCYNNLAACLLHRPNPNYDKINYYCGEVLARDEENTKALYRQGVALYHLKDYDDAKESLVKAAKDTPTDPEIRRYLQLCKEATCRQLRAEKQRCQNIFSKMVLEEDVEEKTRNGDCVMDQ